MALAPAAGAAIMNGLKMKYFVLKPAGDSPHSEASRVAMKAYAQAINQENTQLAYDLEMWVIEAQGDVNRAKIDASFANDKEK